MWVRNLVVVGGLVFAVLGMMDESHAQAPGTVVLSLEEFDALRARAAAEALVFAVAGANYEAGVDGRILRVHAEIRVVVLALEPGFVVVPLLKGSAVVDQASASDGRAILASNEKGETLALVQSSGVGDTVTLAVDFHTGVRQEKGFFTAEFDVPPAGIAQLAVDFPYEETKAYVNGQFAESTADARRHSILRASIGSVNRIALRWLPLSGEIRSVMTVDATLFVQHHVEFTEYLADLGVHVAQRPVEEISVPVPETMTVMWIRGDLIAAYDRSGDRLTIRFREPLLGDARIEAAFSGAYGGDPGQVLSVPHLFPQEVEAVNGVIAFGSSDRFRVRIEKTRNLEPGTPESLPNEALRSRAAQVFQFRVPDWELTYRLEKIEPELTAAVYNSVTFGETTCIVGAQFECLVQQGSYEFFEVSEIPGFRLESVQGDAVRDWSMDREGGPIRIILTRPARGKAVSSAVFRKTYASGESIPVRFPEVFGAKRIRGFVTVQPQTNVKVTPGELRELEILDPSEVPLSMQTAAGGGSLYAYRYLSQPASMALAVERFEGIRVEESVVQKMLTRLTYSVQGTVSSESTLELVNADMDLIPFRIGEGATIRSAKVGEASVAAAQGEATGTVLIPAPKGKVKSTRISLVYLITGEPLDRRREVVLPIPKVPLPVDEVLLQVVPPQGYEVELLSDRVFQPVAPPSLEDLPAPETRVYWLTGPGGEGTIPQKQAEYEMKKIAVALETYYIDHNAYPPVLDPLVGPIAYLKADRSAIGRYVYETDGLSGWKLGVELPYRPDETVGEKVTEGVHFEAKLLRDDPKGLTLEEMLEVKVRLIRKRRGWF